MIVEKESVKWFNDHKGFGFITPDDGSEYLQVHQSSIKSDGFHSLGNGEVVEYTVEYGSECRAKAANVTGPDGASVQGSTSAAVAVDRMEEEGEVAEAATTKEEAEVEALDMEVVVATAEVAVAMAVEAVATKEEAEVARTVIWLGSVLLKELVEVEVVAGTVVVAEVAAATITVVRMAIRSASFLSHFLFGGLVLMFVF